MNRVTAYIIFYGIFFLVLFSMHFYVYFRLNSFFGFLKPKIILALFTLLALSFPVSSIFEKFYPNFITTLLYTFTSVWIGILFLLLCAFLLFEPFALLFKLKTPEVGRTILLSVTVISIYALINGIIVKVKTVDIPFSGIASPIKIVHLSDIHVGTIHNSGYLKKIVAKTNRLNPDMIMITGDFFDGLGPVNKHTVAPLKNLKPKIFFVMGNHEKYENMDRVEQILRATGVVVLRNEMKEYMGLQVVGVDYPEKEGQKDNPVLKDIRIDSTKPSVLLYHTPAGLDEAVKAGIDLQLSGHTHNGQIFPFNYLTKLFYPKINGLYRIKEMILYVTPGTGTWGPPMRLGSNNEIALLSLLPSSI